MSLKPRSPRIRIAWIISLRRPLQRVGRKPPNAVRSRYVKNCCVAGWRHANRQGLSADAWWTMYGAVVTARNVPAAKGCLRRWPPVGSEAIRVVLVSGSDVIDVPPGRVAFSPLAQIQHHDPRGKVLTQRWYCERLIVG